MTQQERDKNAAQVYIKLAFPVGDDEFEGTHYTKFEDYPSHVREELRQAFIAGIAHARKEHSELELAHKALEEILEKSKDNWSAAVAERGLGRGKIGVIDDD